MNINSEKDNIMSVKKQIAEILTQREVWSKDVKNSLEHWLSMKERIEKLEKVINELEKICKKTNVEDENLLELKKYLTELREQTAVNKLMSGVRNGIKQLNILEERFGRNTLNIVVAGVGRCGKSTSLKSILGFDQEDNTVIPSGGGSAVTATKSTVTHVENKEDEKSRIVFLTEAAFLERLNKYFNSCGLDGICDLEEFKNLNFEEISEKFNAVLVSAEKRVEELEYEADTKGIFKDNYDPYRTAKGFYDKLIETDKGVFKDKIEPMHKYFSDYKHLLSADPIYIPLNETYRYVKYPRDESCPLCYAVEECQIYCQFPEDLTGLQVVDLPGWGTADPCEEDVFEKGFGYFVDFVLMVRRPEGTQQGADSVLDQQVVGILKRKLERDLFSDRVLLFQNDGGLKETMKEEDWRSIRNKLDGWTNNTLKIKCIYGDGRSREFMQNEFLHELLETMLEKLPIVDEKLKASNYDTLGKAENDLGATLTEIEKHLIELRGGFLAEGDFQVVDEKVDEIRKSLMNGIIALREQIQNAASDNPTTEKVENIFAELENDFEACYDLESDKVVMNARNVITMTSVNEFATQELREIRIKIRDSYARTEEAHLQKISQVKQDVANIFNTVLSGIFSETETLEGIYQYMRNGNWCPRIVDALQGLLALQFPFYAVAWPPIEENVFGYDVDKYVGEHLYVEDDSSESKAKAALYLLGFFARDKNSVSRDILLEQKDIASIIKSALLRFEDSIIRKQETKFDWIRFVQAHLSQLQKNKKNAYIHEIRQCLDRIG